MFDFSLQLSALDKTDGVQKKVRPSKLNKPTQELLSLLFDSDMFKDAMAKMDLGKQNEDFLTQLDVPSGPELKLIDNRIFHWMLSVG